MPRPTLALSVLVAMGLAGCTGGRSPVSPQPFQPLSAGIAGPAAAGEEARGAGRVVASVEIIGTDGQLARGCWLSAMPDGAAGASSDLRDVGYGTLIGLVSSLVIEKPGQGHYHVRLTGLAPGAAVDGQGRLTAPSPPLSYVAAGIVPLDGQQHPIVLSPEGDAPATLTPAARITAWPANPTPALEIP